jgi:tRNA pseudouridine38-40 synthase
MPTVRLRIDLAYDGTDFHGWAAQPGLRTVQGELEAALGTVLRMPAPAVVCAGRTDTGVHARGQVAHVDVEAEALTAAAGRSDGDPADALARRLDGLLPADVRVRRVATAPDGFDARFSPLWRRYAYRVTDGVPDPLTRGHVLAWPRALDVEALNGAAAALVGLHDFAAFCKQRQGATTVRTLLDLRWARDGDLLTGTVRADAFCHHMVRSLVGCLLAVGEHRRPVAWAGQVLAAGIRDPAVTVSPAHGLTLEEVAYPADADVAVRAEHTRVRRESP